MKMLKGVALIRAQAFGEVTLTATEQFELNS
jgi:hypothetical protein